MRFLIVWSIKNFVNEFFISAPMCGDDVLIEHNPNLWRGQTAGCWTDCSRQGACEMGGRSRRLLQRDRPPSSASVVRHIF